MKELHGADARLAFVVPLGKVPDSARGRAALEAVKSGSVTADETLGALALVGDGITRDVRVLRRAMDVLARERVQQRSVVTTAFRISFLVPRDRLDASTSAMHREFVETRMARRWARSRWQGSSPACICAR